jgi:hypothetical protein
MNEIVETTDLIPDSEKIENIPPFQVGDLVQMRSKALQLARFYKYKKDDVGIVLEVKKGTNEWMVNVHWQKFIPKSGKSIVKHTRLKKVRIRKNVSQKD